MTHEEIVKQKVAVISYLRDYGLDDGDTMTAEEIAELCESIVEHFCTTYRAQVLEEERKRTVELIEGYKVDDGVSFEGALPPAEIFAEMIDDTNMIREHVNGILDMLKEEIKHPTN